MTRTNRECITFIFLFRKKNCWTKQIGRRAPKRGHLSIPNWPELGSDPSSAKFGILKWPLFGPLEPGPRGPKMGHLTVLQIDQNLGQIQAQPNFGILKWALLIYFFCSFFTILRISESPTYEWPARFLWPTRTLWNLHLELDTVKFTRA